MLLAILLEDTSEKFPQSISCGMTASLALGKYSLKPSNTRLEAAESATFLDSR